MQQGPTMTDAMLALVARTQSPPPAPVEAPEAARQALVAAHRGLLDFCGGTTATAVDLSGLDRPSLATVAEALREGEVSMRLTLADGQVMVQESAMTGLWRLHGAGIDRLEIGEVPGLVRTLADALPDGLDIPDAADLPEGAMNVLPVLAEIRDRMARRDPEPYEINLTLLPMTPIDLAVLNDALGTGPVDIMSRGYGKCRVRVTGRRNVWYLQHYNSDDNMILHSLQIGDVPAAVKAAAVDIADSAERLGDIIDSYFP